MPVLCCNARRRKNKPEANSPDSQYKKGLFGLMFAKIDEFESLTPLMTTPESNEESLPSTHHLKKSSEQSPPLPRRLSAGKTFIVPLATNKDRVPVASVLDTLDGRLNSGDGTTKSCATIPEDDETAQTPTNAVKPEGDLISIDRTSASFMEVRTIRYHAKSTIPLPIPAPPFEIPTPLYTPPPPPDRFRPMLFVRSPKNFTRRDFPTAANCGINNNNNDFSNCANVRKSSTCDSITSFSSPAESSYGTDSPLDTSNSLSDNIHFPSESDLNSETKNKYAVQEGDNDNTCDSNYISSNDTEGQIASMYILDRIEEESEHNLEERGCTVENKAVETTTSLFFGGEFMDPEQNIIFPRSVSQQFELLDR